jgi:hypothetical protein
MKTIYILATVLLCAYSGVAQNTATNKAAVKAAAKQMSTALVNKDYKTFVKTTYPLVVAKTEGGTAKLAKDLEQQIADMAKDGTTILAAWPGEPSVIIDTAGEYQCTIPQKMTMRIPQGKITTETTLIALSPDKGKTWYFMDSADRSISKMRSMFPNISSRLVIPTSPEPVFVQEKK